MDFNGSSELPGAIEKAIGFLESRQLPDGEFQTQFFYETMEAADGELVPRPVFDSSPFVTSLLVESLLFLKDDPRVAKMIAAGNRFLQGEMDPGGLWRYWSRKNPRRGVIPPDLDDTSCVSFALKSQGIAVPDNRWVFHDTRDPSGRFYTWVYKADSLRKKWLAYRTKGEAFSYTKELWLYTSADDVCAVVNANVILYLGETSQTRRAIDYLLKIFAEGTEDANIVFYAHRMSLYYMASRALFHGVKALESAREIMVRRIWELCGEDGGFGDELLSAMAICSLLNLGVSVEELVQPVAALIATQSEDGSWPRVPMYGGPPEPTTFGSADLTTGFALEALGRFVKIAGR
jgi:hypothetical protein